jgi:hypothetical protein
LCAINPGVPSQVYNTLKFNVSASTLKPDRPDNVVFVRDPAPPPMPAPPAFPVWPLPRRFTSSGGQMAVAKSATSPPPSVETVTWTIVPGFDNYGFDIKTASECQSNITCLEAACVSLRYCAGFSSAYNTLKFNVSNSTLNPSNHADQSVFVGMNQHCNRKSVKTTPAISTEHT